MLTKNVKQAALFLQISLFISCAPPLSFHTCRVCHERTQKKTKMHRLCCVWKTPKKHDQHKTPPPPAPPVTVTVTKWCLALFHDLAFLRRPSTPSCALISGPPRGAWGKECSFGKQLPQINNGDNLGFAFPEWPVEGVGDFFCSFVRNSCQLSHASFGNMC